MISAVGLLQAVPQVISRESPVPVTLSSNKNVSSSPPRRRPLKGHVPHLQVPHHGAFCSAPDSSMSSPSRSPMRACGYEQVTSTAFTAGKLYPDFPFLGSGQCSSPGSGQTSGHNSMGGDLSGQLFLQPSRGSPEYSPNPSPRMTSPGPGSRIHSGAVTPLHPRAGGGHSESQSNWPDDAKQQSHCLPLPPITISNSSPFSHQNSAVTSPSLPRSPGRAENLASPGSRWKKGKLLGRGTFGHVYVGFNSETGEMCAMKEVTLFADDAKSKESAKQLGQEIALLSRLRHPNIVQYYGSETVGDKLYIYLEYVSGGSIHKILQEYGKLGESAIRSYTQQILSGLAYLHAKNTVHRDIKGANILVDPNGRVKLADFGMAKHITGQSCPLSFKGSPYWMAPERNPLHRPTAAQLLEHSFVKNAAPLEKQIPSSSSSSDHPAVTNAVKSMGIGNARILQLPDTERLAIHSSRVSKSNFHTSDIYIPRNISCPVSPVGSPLLYPRSPQHLSGRMSPSPISSPRTTSGSSTPLTGGIGAIPFHNQPMLSQDSYGNLQMRSPSPCVNSPSYWDPDILRGVQSGSHAFRELTSYDNDALGKQFVRAANGELYDGQSVLADRVSQQLLRDPVKLNPSLDLSPSSPLACNRMTGV
ncbi:UNVERIFIED_CONTAM: Mitogen-activated protein kinase kinase kinase YODA [Sesamum radiatum]|uniref:mitogen-activated protein kinase kinase kinase n=1 Tax=Sesamum radiatum TaxID=300843 RepID=A0AAW2TG83_SESRA